MKVSALFMSICLLGALAAPAQAHTGAPEPVFTQVHRVSVPGGEISVTETYTAHSWFRWPRRAVLFLPGSAFVGNHFAIPVDHYDATAQAARRGFFAFTVDYLGTGASTRPANGTEADFPAQTAAMGAVVDFVRHLRHIPRVDLLGEGYGGAIATQLAANPGRVRSVVMAAMLYDTLVGGPLLDPAFVAILEGSPDGYFFIPGEGAFIFMNGAPPEVFSYVAATQGGFYPTPNFLVAAYQRPFFDPGVARVPGLVIFGPGDIVVGPNGVDGLVRDYGRQGASLVVLEEAGHAPRIESPETAARFWEAVFSFIDR
ncbi:MAG TPA: hypothetical protein DD490_25590 [Acidobacteria bacterium]|nr:hypothetical protein [Acidobacteriota bacterium]